MWSPRAVVFDLDGTLVDHEAASLHGLRALLEGLGVAHVAAADVAAEWHRLEEEHWVAYRQGMISFEEQRRLRMRDFLPVVASTIAEERASEVFDLYLRGYEAGWTAYDDARETLERACSLGLRVAILTNGHQEQQEAKLRAAGLTDLCGPVVASSGLTEGKPSRVAFAAACAAVGERADDVLMVGDNYEVDVLPARAFGMQAVHLDRRGEHPAEDPSRISRLTDLVLSV